MNEGENSDKVIEVFSLLFSITFSLFFPPCCLTNTNYTQEQYKGGKESQIFQGSWFE